MVSNLIEKSSLELMLNLYIDGKGITGEDLKEVTSSLSGIEDLTTLGSHLFLLSIYHHLSPLEDSDSLVVALERIGRKYEKEIQSDIGGALLRVKYLLSSALVNRQVHMERGYDLHISDLSKLDDLLSYGIISFFLGLFLKAPFYLEEGRKVSELILRFTNDSAELDTMFLLEKGSFEKDKNRVAMFVLLSLYKGVCEDSRVCSLLNGFDPFEGGLFQSVDVEKRLLCRLLGECEHLLSGREKLQRKEEEHKGLLQVKTGGFCFTSTSEAKNGVGSISFGNTVVIPSFGPHVLPLGKNDHYGLLDPLAPSGEVKGASVSMWNRVKSEDVYGNHWIHTNAMLNEKNIKIETFLWSTKPSEKLALIYFVRGKELSINETTYHCGGLERVNTVTSKVEVKLNDFKLQIHTKRELEVEIIPLAGQDFFWESDFIVSYPFLDHGMLSFDFVMD